jgi:1-deoxy-D-xylulose-5-phosphate synthase
MERIGAMSELLSRVAAPADLKTLNDQELLQLAQEMRDELVRVLTTRPAHFASNLGVVELCLALHLTFDFSKDRLIWDTGHQIYPHKLVTGRFKGFETIRTKGGLMGYPNPHESPFDLFMTGHAGCSISCALGLKSGDDLLGRGENYSVAVVGDGALPSGIVFEALNNAGHLGKNLLVILNDNKMSICPRVGALAQCLDRARLTNFYQGSKRKLRKILEKVPSSASAPTRRSTRSATPSRPCSPGGCCSRRWASSTSGRWTATTSRGCAAGCARSKARPVRSCCTSSPRRATASSKPATTR